MVAKSGAKKNTVATAAGMAYEIPARARRHRRRLPCVNTMWQRISLLVMTDQAWPFIVVRKRMARMARKWLRSGGNSDVVAIFFGNGCLHQQ